MANPKKTDPKKTDPKDKKNSKVVTDKNGGRSIRTTKTTVTKGTPDRVVKGTPSTTVKGKPATPAVLASKGIKGGKSFDKAFGEARSSGKSVFVFNGKKYNVGMSGTKGKPATKATPDKVIPGKPSRVIKGTPSKTNTTVTDKKIPSSVYQVNATRGTIGGSKRNGVGGSVTTGSQVTSNKAMAGRVVKAQDSYNKMVDKKYAPDTKNERGLNPAQLALKNKKAEQRRKDLQGTTKVEKTGVQSGLERKKVQELRKPKK